MFDSHFDLKQRPFPVSLSVQNHFAARSYEDTLNRLRSAVHQRENVVVVTGAPGTGKTLLCHRFIEQLGGDFQCVFLTHGQFPDRPALLQAILFDLGLPYQGLSEQELRLALVSHVLQSFAEGRSTLVIVDEAQSLSPAQLEELRLLSNLESGDGAAAQIVLVGEPALREILMIPALQPLTRRLCTRLELQPLNTDEAADYVKGQIHAAGRDWAEVFTAEAISIIARVSGGVFRDLNRVCRECLVQAHQADMETVDAEIVLEALDVLGLAAATGECELGELAIEKSRRIETAPLSQQEDPTHKSSRAAPGGGGSRRLFASPRRTAG